MHITKNMIIGISIVLVTAAVTFTMFNLVPTTDVRADDSKQIESKIVSSAEEASAIAGFKAASVSNDRRQLFLPVNDNYFCRFTSFSFCSAAPVR